MEDGLTQTEDMALDILNSIGYLHLALAEQIVGLPWVTDGLTEAELGQLQTLADAANEDPALAFNLLPEMLQSEGYWKEVRRFTSGTAEVTSNWKTM